MRSWADLSTKEKGLFERQLISRHRLSTELRFELETLKIKLFCGPLMAAEESRFEYLLDLAEKEKAS